MDAADHLKYAEAWLELGDWQSAADELDTLNDRERSGIRVLSLRVQIFLKAGNWVEAETNAQKLVNEEPLLPLYSLLLAKALHGQGRNREAYLLLARRFELHSLDICYDAACYACLDGELGIARACLDKAIEIGLDLRFDVLKQALGDPRLKSLMNTMRRVERSQKKGGNGENPSF